MKLSQYFLKEKIDSIARKLGENEYVFEEITLLDYRGKVLILFMPYRSDRYIEIITPLSLFKKDWKYLQDIIILIIMLALVIGSSMSIIFSKKK